MRKVRSLVSQDDSAFFVTEALIEISGRYDDGAQYADDSRPVHARFRAENAGAEINTWTQAAQSARETALAQRKDRNA